MTFDEYLNYWGSQDNSTQMEWTYNFINNLYYDSVTDFTTYLSNWVSSTDSIYTQISNTSSNSERTLRIMFINNENISYYKDGNNIRFTSATLITVLSATFNSNRNTITSIKVTNENRSFINMSDNFFDNTNSTKFLISDNLIYSDNSLTSITSADYYYKKVYTNTVFKYVDNPIYTNYVNQYIKLGEFIGGVDYSNVRVQFGFLNQDNTMGQIIALYGYPDSTLPKLYINNNNLYIDSRLITSDNYAVSVVIDTISYDKVLDIQFINSSGSGNAIFDIQNGTNNIINNNNNNKNDIINNQNQNTDKIISAITQPFSPSGDYGIVSGDFDLGLTYQNPFDNIISEVLELLRVRFLGSQRSIDLGSLPIFNDHVIIDLDGNFKCPYSEPVKFYISVLVNGVLVAGSIYFFIKALRDLTTGNLKSLALEINEEGSFLNWF